MTDSANNQLITDIGRELVSQIAPQEIPIFKAHSEAYFKDPQKALSAQTASDEPLGFGFGEATAFLTPVVLAVTTEVIKFLAEEIKKSIKTESTSLINETVKKMFKSFGPNKKEDGLEPLTAEQIEQIRKLSYTKARQLKLSKKKADLLADSLIGSLVTAPT